MEFRDGRATVSGEPPGVTVFGFGRRTAWGDDPRSQDTSARVSAHVHLAKKVGIMFSLALGRAGVIAALCGAVLSSPAVAQAAPSPAPAASPSAIPEIGRVVTSDRRAEADCHEARLRTLPPEQLPSVDVYVPTYDEPMEVLEKTITGVLCLDYPNFKAWVLDDGRRPWVKAFCESKGDGYLTRPDNAHAKAGNINHALTKTSADFIAIFDADFIPQRSFLIRTVGFFADPRIGIVQVPHAFYNYDPTQTSLALQKALPDDQRDDQTE